MKKPSSGGAAGNALLLALATILILSVVGASVLANLTTRYNVSHTQVRGWKQAQHAAEAAGDIAYAAVRKSLGVDAAQRFEGWTKDGNSYTSPVTTFGGANLMATATVDPFYTDADGNPWYRIRATGTVPLQGLKRVGMDDRMGPDTRGDSLLRKIDFHHDHFIAAYGPKGDGIGKALVPVPAPQLSRRIELVAAPITPFEAAIKASGTYYGLGTAGQVDSFDSKKGTYGFYAESPTHARYPDARSGHVQIGSKSATVMGTLYGNLATNGGLVTGRTTYITGTIDNNVTFSLDKMSMPPMPPEQVSPHVIPNDVTLTPPAAGEPGAPIYYVIDTFVNNGILRVQPYKNEAGKEQFTYMAVRVKSDIGSGGGTGPMIVVPENVRLQVFFERNIETKAENIVNTSGYAGNLQFYGVPVDPTLTQTINLNSGGGSTAGFSAVFYAPGANFTINGGPDITGAIVCKNFYANGNVKWHYDLQLRELGRATDYRIASYVEDTR
jgi:hypothetical protein